MINYTFLKHSYHGKFKYAKIFAKFSETKCLFKETENVQILFTGSCAKELWKICNCAIFFLLFKAFQRAIQSINPMTGSRFNIDLVG